MEDCVVDGALIAQLGIPNMKTPIAYALTYPERLTLDLPALDLCRLGQLHFAMPDQCFLLYVAYYGLLFQLFKFL